MNECMNVSIKCKQLICMGRMGGMDKILSKYFKQFFDSIQFK